MKIFSIFTTRRPASTDSYFAEKFIRHTHIIEDYYTTVLDRNLLNSITTLTRFSWIETHSRLIKNRLFLENNISGKRDLNPRPLGPEPSALPAALLPVRY